MTSTQLLKIIQHYIALYADVNNKDYIVALDETINDLIFLRQAEVCCQRAIIIKNNPDIKSEVFNWSIRFASQNEFQAPEISPKVLMGEIIVEEKRKFMTSSAIQSYERFVNDEEDYVIIKTLNSQYLIRRQNINPEAELLFPNYYDRAFKEVNKKINLYEE